MKNNVVVFFLACVIHILYVTNSVKSAEEKGKAHLKSINHLKADGLRREGSFTSSGDAHDHHPVYNYSRIASLLRSRGYDVYEPGDSMPVVLFGRDRAMPASLVLPELSDLTERGGTSHIIHSTWRSKKGETVIHYFYDEESKPNTRLFEEAAMSWAAHTCIRFEKTGQTKCSDTVYNPSFCVGNFGGCWSFVGKSGWGGEKTGKGKAQRLSVASNCELDACIHEFGHGLGFQHQQSRPDRDASISVNWENFKISGAKNWEKALRNTWMQGTRCAKKQVADIPTPYDYLSVVQYGTFAFVDDDVRPSFVTKNVKHQWMVDYHRSRGMGPSHYDLYVINSAYKCIDIWQKTCSENNRTVPKCANYGYLTKECSCQCSAGFVGPTCKNSTGSLFPLMEKAECYIEWNYPGIIDMSNMNLDFEKRTYANMKFNHMQFCTVIVDTLRADKRPIMWLDPSELMVKRRKLIELLHRTGFVTHVLPQLHLFDCRLFFKLFWTSDHSHRKRTECFSSIFNVGSKVTKEKMLSLRSKGQVLSLYFNVVYDWSQPPIEFLEAAMKLKLQVVFVPIPQKALVRGDTFVQGAETTLGATFLPPTIPPELRFETTTPNIFGMPLPMMFQDDENPRLSFIGWTLIGLGALLCTFFLGVCVSEQIQVRKLLQVADRHAALNENRRYTNLLAAGWVRLRGVDVDDEVRKEREERRSHSPWAARMFGINDSSDSDDDDADKAVKRRQKAKEKQTKEKQAKVKEAKVKEAKAKEAKAKKGAQGKGMKTRGQLMKERAAAKEGSSSSSEEEVSDKKTNKLKPVKEKQQEEESDSDSSSSEEETRRKSFHLPRLKIAAKEQEEKEDKKKGLWG